MRLGHCIFPGAVVQVDAYLATFFNIEISHPTSSVRQENFNIVMAGIEFNHANGSRCLTCRSTIYSERKAFRVCRDLNLAVMNSAFLPGISRRRSAGQRKRERYQDREGNL